MAATALLRQEFVRGVLVDVESLEKEANEEYLPECDANTPSSLSSNESSYQALKQPHLDRQNELFLQRKHTSLAEDTPWPEPKAIKTSDFDPHLHRQGRWTETEHRAFEEAILMYGKDYVKI